MAGLAGLIVFGPARAETTDHQAYAAATKCFIANGLASRSRKKAGDEATAASYDAKAHESFNTAVQLGRSIGLSGQQIDRDFDMAQTTELPKMMGTTAYFQDTVATCKAYGLM